MSDPTAKSALPSGSRPASARLSLTWALLAGYAALLVYGSLYPLSGWQETRGGLRILLGSFSLRHLSRSDLITNLVVYIPLGLLMMRSWRTRLGNAAKIAWVTAGGAAVSLCLEYAQSYLPTRVSSLVDVSLNGLGTLLGALLAQGIAAHSVTGLRLRRLRDELFLPGRMINLGLMVMSLWVLSQLMPLVPSLDRGTLVEGIRPLLRFLSGAAGFHSAQSLVYVLNIAAAGVIGAALLRPERPFLPLFALGVGAVLLLKIPVVGRQLSPEALAGAAGGVLLLGLLIRLPVTARLWAAGLMVLVGFAVAQLQPSSNPYAPLLAMNWIPFRIQMEGLSGLDDIAETLWPFAALAYLVLLARPRRAAATTAAGTLLVFVFAFVTEWLQTRIPGRYPDVTDAGLAALGWWLPWLYARRSGGEHAPTPAAAQPERATPVAFWVVTALLAVVLLTVGLNKVFRTGDQPLDEDRLPRLPAAAEIAPVRLVHFHDAHPRLPAPSDAELTRLRQENPQYITHTAQRARRGDLSASVFMAYAQPGSVDLPRLHQRLMALRFTGRGHEQTKPLAIAYDWLYPQWNDMQRAQLRGKLAEGCDYEIEFIRRTRLSPYNVYLYNSPLQALMACAIALYHDDPRGDPVMAFTADYWMNRVLPVWRQIMGINGGWHEGGEYLGIGIGQAIYALPAMWRKATGEDLFATEPGIRGFLDFVIYRTRPDGSDFRWGDGGYFHRPIPDLLPLAMEYGNRAAYSLRTPPPRPVPSSWPWGPLSDNRLYDPEAVAYLPLTALFDGLGMIVARSDWGPDATYLSFKAGDNYWSHSHLDQGAFTIYKGGALAIDSGLYGPDYGADHHMDYQYQTIAHNTITVTDPADTVPAPARDGRPPRPIANDGGQRRVGSGWGVEAAPLDLDEWQRKRDIYHTGTLERLLIKDGLTVAVADLTPAYTNANSGRGHFSDRTRRVEDFHRIFGYDRSDDVIVVFDHVAATQAQFPKRWLLHTLEKPRLNARGFTVETPPGDGIGHAGGRLQGYVLLPRDAAVALVGGPGHEFFIDGKNYDEGVARALAHHPDAEPGRWRIEVRPPAAHNEDNFLVVMLPSLLKDAPAAHTVRLLQGKPGTVGLEIRGPHHTSRWYFDPSARDVRIEIQDGGGSRSYEPAGGAAPRPGQLPTSNLEAR
jgi:VanZ family protein